MVKSGLFSSFNGNGQDNDSDSNYSIDEGLQIPLLSPTDRNNEQELMQWKQKLTQRASDCMTKCRNGYFALKKQSLNLEKEGNYRAILYGLEVAISHFPPDTLEQYLTKLNSRVIEAENKLKEIEKPEESSTLTLGC